MKGQLLEDMDAMYERSKEDPNKESSDVTVVVKKYFPVGMNISDALEILDNQGFEITEYTLDGFRRLPNGELWNYQDEAHKRSAKVSEGRIGYLAKKKFDRYLMVMLLGKSAVIVIDSDGESIINSSGYVYLDGI